MKRTIAIVITAVMLLGALSVFAGQYRNEREYRDNYRYQNYVDKNNDGVCDHYEDGNNNRNRNDYRKNCPNGNRMRNNGK